MSLDIEKLTMRKAQRLAGSATGAPPARSQDELDNRLLDAAMLGRPGAVAIFISQGADPKACDTAGFTALMCAAFAGCRDCIELLLPVSELKALDYSGNDVYACAARSREPLAIRAQIMAYHRSQIERASIESLCEPAPKRKSRMGL